MRDTLSQPQWTPQESSTPLKVGKDGRDWIQGGPTLT